MKIIVTGSLGNIGKPLTQELVQKGHQVTVISSNADKKEAIEKLGATAAIGSLEDVDFIQSPSHFQNGKKEDILSTKMLKDIFEG